jgi:hypothetical protein
MTAAAANTIDVTTFRFEGVNRQTARRLRRRSGWADTVSAEGVWRKTRRSNLRRCWDGRGARQNPDRQGELVRPAVSQPG